MADNKKRLEDLLLDEVKGFYPMLNSDEWEHFLKFLTLIREDLSNINKIILTVDKVNTQDDVMFKGLSVITQKAKVDVLDKIIRLIAQYKKMLEKGEKNG